MIKRLFLILSLFAAPLCATRVFESTTVANLPLCKSSLTGNAFYVTDAASTSVCTGAGAGNVDRGLMDFRHGIMSMGSMKQIVHMEGVTR